MRIADFKARIKKIEIMNTGHSDFCLQSTRLILEDIDLTNENLMELRQFRANEPVYVEIRPIQTALFEETGTAEMGKVGASGRGRDAAAGIGQSLPERVSAQSEEMLNCNGFDDDFATITEGDQVEGQIIKQWNFE